MDERFAALRAAELLPALHIAQQARVVDAALRALPRLAVLNLNGGQKRNSGTWVVTLNDRDLEVVADLKQLGLL